MTLALCQFLFHPSAVRHRVVSATKFTSFEQTLGVSLKSHDCALFVMLYVRSTYLRAQYRSFVISPSATFDLSSIATFYLVGGTPVARAALFALHLMWQAQQTCVKRAALVAVGLCARQLPGCGLVL